MAIILPDHSYADDDTVITRLQQRYAQTHFDKKILGVSEYLLNRPYCLGALGEGRQGVFDQSPIYRTDRFDCLTFINTILALTFSHDLKSFQKKIQAMRYFQLPIDYAHRCHIMSLDWNRYHASQGMITDITHTILHRNGRKMFRSAQAVIDKKAWFEHRTSNNIKLQYSLSLREEKNLLEKLRHSADTAEAKSVNIHYLPMPELFNANKQIKEDILTQLPCVSLLEIVRPNWDLRETIGTHLHISHIGLAFKKEQHWWFRHASSQYNTVTDVALCSYLAQYLNHETIKGVNLQRVAL
jgi:hypothetical protein